jgi:hypothetical protein
MKLRKSRSAFIATASAPRRTRSLSEFDPERSMEARTAASRLWALSSSCFKDAAIES